MIRALLRLGKTCASDVSGMTLTRAEMVGFDLKQLFRVNTTSSKQKYLDEGRAGKYAFLYHACANSSSVHVFALFLPDGAVRLHLVDPAVRRQAIPNLRELYTELIEKRLDNVGPSISVDYPAEREFTTAYHGTDLVALRAISRELGLVANQNLMLVISSVCIYIVCE